MTTTLEGELRKGEPQQVASGLQGRLKKNALPYMMGNLFTPKPDKRGWLRNIDAVTVFYLTPAEAAAAWLPSEFHLPRLPVGEAAVVCLTFVRYGEGGTVAPYSEAYASIPCLWEGRPYGYCPYICVDTDEALVSGRELMGFPKKLATFDLDASETQFAGAITRRGVRVLQVAFEQHAKLFSVPLPARERVALPSPYDLIYPLPDPTGEPQTLPFEAVTTRFIPDAIAPQHIVSLWRWETGTVWAGKGHVEYAPSDDDPLAKLPVAQVIASTRFKGDVSMDADQTRLLAEMA